MKSSHIRAITEDENGMIYVATTCGIAMIDPQGNLSMMEEAAIAEMNMRGLLLGQDGIIYGLTNFGDILKIRDGKLLNFYGIDENPVHGAGTCFPDPEEPGKIYMEGADFGFYHVTYGDTLEDFEKIDIQPLSYVQQLEYIDGKVWVCVANGIGVIEDGKFQLLQNLPMDSNVGHVWRRKYGEH